MAGLPAGAYDSVLTQLLASRIESQSVLKSVLIDLDNAEAAAYLARHISEALQRVLSGDAFASVDEKLHLCNRVLAVALEESKSTVSPADDLVAEPARILRSLFRAGIGANSPLHPITPLSTSALYISGNSEPSISAAIQRELESADRVDLICAFIGFSGVRILQEDIRKFICRGGRLRVLTSTYLQATQKAAVDKLCELGAEVRIGYEQRTKLHAKAWLFARDSGFSTAFVGSSNLSRNALVEGLEWNVRLSEKETPYVVRKFASTFERYWSDTVYEPYDPQRTGAKLELALSSDPTTSSTIDFYLDVQPYPHQREILEKLASDRAVHGRMKNLVVAATGTGKTVVAALDYKSLASARRPTLLFVAHREEILRQSCDTFRHVLRDGAFGELMVGGRKPRSFRHVFASIQSLARLDLETLGSDQFEIVIIDEFHHAEARTYRRLLDCLEPTILLGLTATPERADGIDVKSWFDPAGVVELRLWDALDQQILSPFQYFGVSDQTDLRSLRWARGGYEVADLEEVYTNSDARVNLVLQKLQDLIPNPRRMKALAFCVSVEHARFMAERFSRAGLPAAAVTGSIDGEDRRPIIQDLRSGKLSVICAVDVFNEGVDIPDIDTVLFLRPTESATIFIQQLGRGLRLSEGKTCLTVLDFVGNQHKKFRFDLKLRAMTGLGRRELEHQVREGFVSLPAGCHIEFDRVAQEHVLQSLREAMPTSRRELVSEIRQLEVPTLQNLLDRTGLELGDVYRSERYFTDLAREAGKVRETASLYEGAVGPRTVSLLHINDVRRLQFYGDALSSTDRFRIEACSEAEVRQIHMLCALLGTRLDAAIRRQDVPEVWRKISDDSCLCRELIDLFSILMDRSDGIQIPLSRPSLADVPIRIHSSYLTREIACALGIDNPSSLREGVRHLPTQKADAFFVTLRKTSDRYSQTTRYSDLITGERELVWESQSTLRQDTTTADRYINHAARDHSILVFVRATPQDPYFFAGPCNYQSHTGERPITFRWEFEHPLPEVQYRTFLAASG